MKNLFLVITLIFYFNSNNLLAESFFEFHNFQSLTIGLEDDNDVKKTLYQNSSIIDQLAQLAPMSINPYATIFITSLFSKFGFQNDYIAVNPFFNSWLVVILFGFLFIFTSLVGTFFKTNKVTAPIALADNYLSNKAALIVNGFIVLAPSFLNNSPIDNEIVYQAGFLSINFKTFFVLLISMYFLIVVMTVRFFIDILIFISPIPLIDSFLEIFKIILTICFVFISIVSPLISVIISILMFIMAIIFYKRSMRLINKTKYLIIYPILNLFRSKEQILTNGKTFSILVYVSKKSTKIKKGKIVRLEKINEKFFLIRNRFILSDIKEEISFVNYSINQKTLNINILNKLENKALMLNRSYHNHIEDIANTLNIEILNRADSENKNHKGFINKLKNMFNVRDISDFKSV